MFELYDTWSINGNGIEDFKNAVNELASHTKHIKVLGDQLSVFSDASKSEYSQKGSSDKLYFWELNQKTLSNMGKYGKLSSRVANNNGNPLMQESIEKNGFILIYNTFGKNIPLYVSSSAIPTLCARAKIGGDKISTPSLARDINLAEYLTNEKTEMTLVIRDNGKSSKVFAAMSEKYNPIPMTILNDVIDELAKDASLGTPVCKGWHIDHNFTDCYIEFPEAAKEFKEAYKLKEKVIPGIFLSSSDTGDCSVTIRGTYRKEHSHSYVITEEVRQRHMGISTTKEIIDSIKEEILKNIRLLPECLALKIGSPLTPASLDLTVSKDRKKNLDIVSKAIKIGSRKLEIVKAIGKKREKEVIECLIATLRSDMIYTEYDVAMMFMTLADKIAGLNRDLTLKLSKALADSAFISYKEEESEADSEETIYLVA